MSLSISLVAVFTIFLLYHVRETCIMSYLSTGWAKKLAPFFVRFITSPNINRFSKFIHCQNQEKICNKSVTINPITSEVCRYTTL